jgi:hypothetical protein
VVPSLQPVIAVPSRFTHWLSPRAHLAHNCLLNHYGREIVLLRSAASKIQYSCIEFRNDFFGR